jgi:hypothetical protein
LDDIGIAQHPISWCIKMLTRFGIIEDVHQFKNDFAAGFLMNSMRRRRHNQLSFDDFIAISVLG